MLGGKAPPNLADVVRLRYGCRYQCPLLRDLDRARDRGRRWKHERRMKSTWESSFEIEKDGRTSTPRGCSIQFRMCRVYSAIRTSSGMRTSCDWALQRLHRPVQARAAVDSISGTWRDPLWVVRGFVEF